MEWFWTIISAVSTFLLSYLAIIIVFILIFIGVMLWTKSSYAETKNKFEKFKKTSDVGKEITEPLWDRFILNFTPKWFEILGWMFLLGGLNYIGRKTNSTSIGIILIGSYLLVAESMNSYLRQNKLLGYFRKNFKFWFVLDAIITILIATLFYWFIQITLNELSIN